jgi:hypothetical protein
MVPSDIRVEHKLIHARDGAWIISSTGSEPKEEGVFVWDLASGHLANVLDVGGPTVAKVAILPDGPRIVASCMDAVRIGTWGSRQGWRGPIERLAASRASVGAFSFALLTIGACARFTRPLGTIATKPTHSLIEGVDRAHEAPDCWFD